MRHADAQETSGTARPRPSADVRAVRTAIDAMARTLEEVRDALNRGFAVDLVGLSERIDALSIHCLALPGPDARSLLPDLADLIDRLDGLATILQQLRDGPVPASDQRGGPAAARRRAAQAYGRPSPPAGPGDPSDR